MQRTQFSISRNLHKKHGFTLIELLVVIAIIALLAAILFPVFCPCTRECAPHQLFEQCEADWAGGHAVRAGL